MSALSVFIDESGDFGQYENHSPYYIVTLVFHEQASDIERDITLLNMKLREFDLANGSVHTGPLIRREKEYSNWSLLERKQIFNTLYNFTRKIDIKYCVLVVEKKSLIEEMELIAKLTKQLTRFLNEHFTKLSAYDRIIVYYDYGQTELTKILVSVFNAILNSVEFKKAKPADYKLFQATDMICTMELLALKMERKALSKSEIAFFTSEKNIRKPYLKTIREKRISITI